MFEVVFQARTQSEADIVIGVLRNAGLHPMDLPTAAHFTLAGADVRYKVEVPADEVEAARNVLSKTDYQRPSSH